MATTKPQLNQVVALVTGKKAQATKVLTEVYHSAQKRELFVGLHRVYTPKDDAGDGRPPESKQPQLRATDLYAKVEHDLVDMFDAVATQDWANCSARADVEVDGRVVLAGCPVTYLLFLEKRVNELKNFAEQLPVRDPAEEWQYSPEGNCYLTPVARRHSTQKVQRALVLFPATDKHPAQTQLITEDQVVGYWDERKSSTAVTQADKDTVLARLAKLSDAVKVARERANSVEVERQAIGQKILDYAFAGVLKK